MLDARSPYKIYETKERDKRIRERLKLGEWEIDKDVKALMDLYTELFNASVSVKTLISIQDGLVTSRRVIDKLREKIESIIDTDIEELDESETLRMVGYVQELLKMSQAIPKAIDTLKDLEEKIKKEQSADLRIRGGGEKGLFED